jgi:predicted phage tail protein
MEGRLPIAIRQIPGQAQEMKDGRYAFYIAGTHMTRQELEQKMDELAREY